MPKLNKEIKTKIIQYCKDLITTLNLEYLKINEVYKNEFLEYLYLSCVEKWKIEGTYELDQEMISILFSVKKNNETYMKKIKNKEIIILGIDEFDNLIINDNEIADRTKDERIED